MDGGIFVSPHFDDICFAMGSTAAKLRLRRKLLITVFTHSDEVSNPIVLDKMQGLDTPARIAATTRLRDAEDDLFAAALDFAKHSLGFDDADLLAGPEHENPLVHYDGMDKEINDVAAVLQPMLGGIVAQQPGAAVFCPLAIGEHRNHLVAFAATVASAPPTASSSFTRTCRIPRRAPPASTASRQSAPISWNTATGAIPS